MKNILLYLLLLTPLFIYSYDECETSLSTRNKIFKSFEQAQQYIQNIGITSQTQYHEMSRNGKRPDDIPSNPNKTYKNKGWISWGHFLGTNRIASNKKQFRDFEQTQKYVQQQSIISSTQYNEMKSNGKLPDDIPSNPNQTYKNKGWVNWGHFLGTNRIASNKKQFRDFEQAQKYVQQQSIATRKSI